MISFNEWKQGQNTKTITITCRDVDNTLEELLKHIKSLGNTGHSFPIVVDESKKFEWDGDGADSIFKIEVSKPEKKKPGLSFKFDVEGEPVEI
jgi:hypothetical protein